MSECLPLVSVLIAARDEAAYIDDCLDALDRQSYPAERMEIILIDGASSDGTAERAAAWSERRQRPVRILRNRKRITPAAFNLGIEAAHGEVIVILGTHARTGSDFLAASVAALRRTDADAVGGTVRTVGESGRALASAIALAQRSPFGVGDAHYRYATTVRAVDTVNYGAYRREVFERIGGFDESISCGEDCELNYRLRGTGGRLVLDPAIEVEYLARPSLAALWRQRYHWGRHKPEIALRHPRQMRPRHAVPGVFVAALLGGLALWPLGAGRRRVLQGTLGAYGLAMLLATLQLGVRNSWPRGTAFVPLSFVTMHVAYGLGTLVGVIKTALAGGQTR